MSQIILTNVGENKPAVIKVFRNITGLGLKESKDAIDTIEHTKQPITIQTMGLSQEVINQTIREFQMAGATAYEMQDTSVNNSSPVPSINTPPAPNTTIFSTQVANAPKQNGKKEKKNIVQIVGSVLSGCGGLVLIILLIMGFTGKLDETASKLTNGAYGEDSTVITVEMSDGSTKGFSISDELETYQFAGESEEILTAVLGYNKNKNGLYPSDNAFRFLCDNGKVVQIFINSQDNSKLYRISLKDDISDLENKLINSSMDELYIEPIDTNGYKTFKDNTVVTYRDKKKKGILSYEYDSKGKIVTMCWTSESWLSDNGVADEYNDFLSDSQDTDVFYAGDTIFFEGELSVKIIDTGIYRDSSYPDGEFAYITIEAENNGSDSISLGYPNLYGDDYQLGSLSLLPYSRTDCLGYETLSPGRKLYGTYYIYDTNLESYSDLQAEIGDAIIIIKTAKN